MLDTEKKYLDKLHIDYEVKKPTLINFRCPICGDSSTREHIRRGFLMKKEDGILYTCHNECGNMSFYKFLEHQDENLAKQYYSETVKTRFKNRNEKEKKDVFKSTSKMKTKKFDGKKVSVTIKDERRTFKLKSIKLSREAKTFIKSRGLSVKEAEDLGFLYNEDLNAIVFPLYTSEQKDEIYGVQFRLIEKKHFLNFVFDESFKYWGEYLIANAPYGSDVYVFESIFDAISSGLENVIAMLGADLSEEATERLKNYNLTFCFDNDEAGREKTLKYSNLGHDCLVHSPKIKVKDLNDMLIRGVPKEKISKYVLKHIKSPKMSILKTKLKHNYSLYNWE